VVELKSVSLLPHGLCPGIAAAAAGSCPLMCCCCPFGCVTNQPAVTERAVAFCDLINKEGQLQLLQYVNNCTASGRWATTQLLHNSSLCMHG